MNKRVWPVILMAVCFSLMASGLSADNVSDKQFEKDLQEATVTLYFNTEEGDLVPACSAVAFYRGEGNTYLFMTSSACVADDLVLREYGDLVFELDFYLAFNEAGQTNMFPAELARVFLSSEAYSGGIAIFQTVLYRNIPVIPLSLDETYIGEKLVSFSPVGNPGKPLLNGSVTEPQPKDPLNVNGMKNSSVIVMNFDLNNGVKPSVTDPVIVSLDRRSIVAIFVGTANYLGMEQPVAVPLHRILLPLDFIK